MEKQLFSAMQGWQCPICKRVYSPFTNMCLYCGDNKVRTNLKYSTDTGGFVQEKSSDFRNQETV